MIEDLTPNRVFIVVNAVMTAYFSGVMVRLMLTLTPCLCVLGGIGLSVTIERVVASEPVIPEPEVEKELESDEDSQAEEEKSQKKSAKKSKKNKKSKVSKPLV